MRYHLIKEKTFDLCREASQKNAQIKTLSFKAGGGQFKNLIIFQLKTRKIWLKKPKINCSLCPYLRKEGGVKKDTKMSLLGGGCQSK